MTATNATQLGSCVHVIDMAQFRCAKCHAEFGAILNERREQRNTEQLVLWQVGL